MRFLSGIHRSRAVIRGATPPRSTWLDFAVDAAKTKVRSPLCARPSAQTRRPTRTSRHPIHTLSLTHSLYSPVQYGTACVNIQNASSWVRTIAQASESRSADANAEAGGTQRGHAGRVGRCVVVMRRRHKFWRHCPCKGVRPPPRLRRHACIARSRRLAHTLPCEPHHSYSPSPGCTQLSIAPNALALRGRKRSNGSGRGWEGPRRESKRTEAKSVEESPSPPYSSVLLLTPVGRPPPSSRRLRP